MFCHDLRVVVEWFMADGALAVLLGDFLVQQNPHGGSAHGQQNPQGGSYPYGQQQQQYPYPPQNPQQGQPPQR